MFAFVSKSPRAFDLDIQFGGGKLCEGVHACVTDSLSLKQVRGCSHVTHLAINISLRQSFFGPTVLSVAHCKEYK